LQAKKLSTEQLNPGAGKDFHFKFKRIISEFKCGFQPVALTSYVGEFKFIILNLNSKFEFILKIFEFKNCSEFIFF